MNLKSIFPSEKYTLVTKLSVDEVYKDLLSILVLKNRCIFFLGILNHQNRMKVKYQKMHSILLGLSIIEILFFQ